MSLILPRRCESHEHLGEVVILNTDDGWAEVGKEEDVDCRLHWFRFQSIAIRCESSQASFRLKPFLTLEDARKAMITGMYYEKRQENKTNLRSPDELIRPIFTDTLNQPLQGLNWYEANILCELRYGRLATEKEVDMINHHLSQYMPPHFVEKVWTSSKWSHWSYALCGYDANKKRWYAVEDINLINQENQVSQFNLKSITREGVSPKTNHATIGAMIVFDIDEKNVQ